MWVSARERGSSNISAIPTLAGVCSKHTSLYWRVEPLVFLDGSSERPMTRYKTWDPRGTRGLETMSLLSAGFTLSFHWNYVWRGQSSLMDRIQQLSCPFAGGLH